MKVCALPLDSRPCNFSNLFDLAAFSGIKLSQPTFELIHSHLPHDFSAQSKWLRDQLQGGVDAAVVSTDQWIYGGLVRSRKLEIGIDEADRRLNALLKLRAEFPKTKFFLFSTLLRLTVTVNATQSEQLWKDVFRFSVLKGKQKPKPEEIGELKKLEATIPAPVLKEYLSVRARNFAINATLVSFADKFNGMMFGQEDCAEEGLHRKEKADLESLQGKLPDHFADRVAILTGADELGMQSLMRAYQVHHSVASDSIPLSFYTPDERIWNRVSLFEDISVIQNTLLHLEYSPFQFESESELKNANVVIHPFGKEGQTDHLFPEFESKEIKIDWTKDLGNQALLDLEIGNGVSPSLWKSAAEAGKLNQLNAFSAWNTTGNRTGALIAHLGLKEIATKKALFVAEKERRYHLLRLLDDGVYQAFVRKDLWKICKDRGLNPWALGEVSAEFEQVLNVKMVEAAKLYGLDVSGFKFKLPWQRLFELEIIHPV